MCYRPVVKQVFPDTSWRTVMKRRITVQGTAMGVAGWCEQAYILHSMTPEAAKDRDGIFGGLGLQPRITPCCSKGDHKARC